MSDIGSINTPHIKTDYIKFTKVNETDKIVFIDYDISSGAYVIDSIVDEKTAVVFVANSVTNHSKNFNSLKFRLGSKIKQTLDSIEKMKIVNSNLTKKIASLKRKIALIKDNPANKNELKTMQSDLIDLEKEKKNIEKVKDYFSEGNGSEENIIKKASIVMLVSYNQKKGFRMSNCSIPLLIFFIINNNNEIINKNLTSYLSIGDIDSIPGITSFYSISSAKTLANCTEKFKNIIYVTENFVEEKDKLVHSNELFYDKKIKKYINNNYPFKEGAEAYCNISNKNISGITFKHNMQLILDNYKLSKCTVSSYHPILLLGKVISDKEKFQIDMHIDKIVDSKSYRFEINRENLLNFSKGVVSSVLSNSLENIYKNINTKAAMQIVIFTGGSNVGKTFLKNSFNNFLIDKNEENVLDAYDIKDLKSTLNPAKEKKYKKRRQVDFDFIYDRDFNYSEVFNFNTGIYDSKAIILLEDKKYFNEVERDKLLRSISVYDDVSILFVNVYCDKIFRNCLVKYDNFTKPYKALASTSGNCRLSPSKHNIINVENMIWKKEKNNLLSNEANNLILFKMVE